MGTYSFNGSLPTFNGMPMVGGFPTGLTKCFFVDYGNGSDSYSEKSNSVSRPWKTVEYAYSKLTTNKNEGIALMGNTTHALAAMLPTAKNRIHLFGYDPGGRLYGQNAKISLGVSGVAANIGTILNTGVRNSFVNLKIMNSDTGGTTLYSFVEGGEYTVIDLCEIYKDSLLTTSLAAEMVMNGDSAQVTRTTIGSLANAQTGTTIRPGVLVTAGIAGTGLVARDVYFGGCKFWKRAGHVNGRHVYGANATDVERIMEFEQCTFVNAKNAAAVPAQCVAFGSSLTVGQVLMNNCTSINNTALSTTTGVLIAGAVPTYATSGIAVQS